MTPKVIVGGGNKKITFYYIKAFQNFDVRELYKYAETKITTESSFNQNLPSDDSIPT